MGPRNRRRLLVAAGAVGVIAVIVVAVVLVSGSGSSKPKVVLRPGVVPGFESHYVGKTDARYDAHSEAVTFGMTMKQVLRIVGPPTKKVRNCLQYRVNKSVSLGSDHSIFNADRLCFDFGRYAEKHSQVNGIWDYQAPLPVFTR